MELRRPAEGAGLAHLAPGDPACTGRHRLPLRSSGAPTDGRRAVPASSPHPLRPGERVGAVRRSVPGERFGRAVCGDDGRVPPPTAPALARRSRCCGRARSPRRRRHPSFERGNPPPHPLRQQSARVVDDLGLDRCSSRVRGSGVRPVVAGDAQAVPAATCAPRSRARPGAPVGDRTSARCRRMRADRAEPRIRARERGHALDVRRTVDASIRAGLRLTPCFVEHKRAPDYLAVIEQRSAHDVLAAYHARTVEQVGAHGVAVRRVGLQPRTPLIVDPVRGRRRLETLQPTSDRERLLLFAHDRSLRDPFSGRPRPWLSRFGRWSETIQIPRRRSRPDAPGRGPRADRRAVPRPHMGRGPTRRAVERGAGTAGAVRDR